MRKLLTHSDQSAACTFRLADTCRYNNTAAENWIFPFGISFSYYFHNTRNRILPLVRGKSTTVRTC